MNRLTVSIVFQNQNAWPFRIVRIVFDYGSARQTVDHVTNQHTVRREFFIAVIGYTNLAACDQRSHTLQGLTQSLDPFLFLTMLAGVRFVPLDGSAHPRALMIARRPSVARVGPPVWLTARQERAYARDCHLRGSWRP
ncbi:MAG: hypothetical protein A3I61_09005 [Acidobacteria bacterium RIFCSPLOWO2_02_FULL_68_18]|nr:MAG: hypothetical protein A3I61_09005 [Acidobacteria bacterium RIFCSPLOWO2_02_FULL_68_18]OFW49758.1 MAG: hypothetical protein A3G77_00980 [Acidobacteria bacterium RIFCSPLOWO2_12_FULL_68_19]